MKKCFLLTVMLVSLQVAGQGVSARLAAAYGVFEKDPQLAHAVTSLYVEEVKTGRQVFNRNGHFGLAPASTQKIITSATAFALLGKDFRYETKIAVGADGKTIYLLPSGDPSFGSWRWESTAEGRILKEITAALKSTGQSFDLFKMITNDDGGPFIPDGWIWQDVGNYYGTAAGPFSWRENQFDLHLRSGANPGSDVLITGTRPKLFGYALHSFLKAGAKGSGDNAYIYFPLTGDTGVVRGTIPAGESRFVISGAIPKPFEQLAGTLFDTLQQLGMAASKPQTGFISPTGATGYKVVYTHLSPTLDELSKFFLKRSINLYGEALLQTMGAGKEKPVSVIKDYWKTRGVSHAALNMVDGSGLSPLNRVTTEAMVKVLQEARRAPWFEPFYDGFPLYNGMRIKSGTISGVKGFCGYHKAADGTEYVFSFIVNNYNGSASALVQKMYTVLNVLK